MNSKSKEAFKEEKLAIEALQEFLRLVQFIDDQQTILRKDHQKYAALLNREKSKAYAYTTSLTSKVYADTVEELENKLQRNQELLSELKDELDTNLRA